MYLGLLQMNQFNADVPQSPSNRIILGFSTWLFLSTVAMETRITATKHNTVASQKIQQVLDYRCQTMGVKESAGGPT